MHSGTGFIFTAPTTSKAEEWVTRINAGTRWTEVSEDAKSSGHRIPVLEVPAPALAECDPSEEDPDVRNISGLMKTWLRELPPLISLRGERMIEAHQI